MNVPIVAALCLLAVPAAAQQQQQHGCGPTAVIEDDLRTRYGEIRIWTGLDARTNNSVVLFADPSGSTWTVMIEQSNLLCAAFSGSSWAIPGPHTAESPT